MGPIVAATSARARDRGIPTWSSPWRCIPVPVIGGGVAVGLRLRAGREGGPRAEAAPFSPSPTRPPGTGGRRGCAAPDRIGGPHRTAPSASRDHPGRRTTRAVARRAGRTRRAGHPIRSRLGKARGLLSGYLGSVRTKGKVDAGTWDDLEEALIRADVGVGATDRLLEDLRARVKAGEIAGPDALVEALKSDLVVVAVDRGRHARRARTVRTRDGTNGADDRPVDVWLFVGVNGVGKTTTVGKVASRLSAVGSKVLLAAGDTFRAAAGEQLSMWATRADADIVRGSEGGDPELGGLRRRASARHREGHAVVLADTAGRLHNKVNLIEELKKIRRVADRPPGRCARCCSSSTPRPARTASPRPRSSSRRSRSSGVVLTKLDGTAKGGIVVAIQRELGLPVKLVGLGEGVDDLIDFDPVAFVDALF